MGLRNKPTKEELQRAAEQRQRLIAYQRVFLTPEGKEVLFDLMNRCHTISDITGEGREADRAEGRRQVMNHILKQANFDLGKFDKLMRGDLT